jgi:hypothetical protein
MQQASSSSTTTTSIRAGGSSSSGSRNSNSRNISSTFLPLGLILFVITSLTLTWRNLSQGNRIIVPQQDVSQFLLLPDNEHVNTPPSLLLPSSVLESSSNTVPTVVVVPRLQHIIAKDAPNNNNNNGDDDGADEEAPTKEELEQAEKEFIKQEDTAAVVVVDNNDHNNNNNSSEKEKEDRTRTTIAYTVTVTSCKNRQLVMDGASVLQHSIHLATQNSIKYDYQMVAFVHRDGAGCIDILRMLNYTVHIKSVPFAIENIQGEYRKWANRTGCCGEKEWLKLYAYTLTQYPVAVHLDLDCLVLKPLDDLFDAMIPSSDGQVESPEPAIIAAARERIPAMWTQGRDMPTQIDAFFTRDYGMVQKPGLRQPHQIGVQGGFLVVRPNQAVFDEYIDIILAGNYTESRGWGDKLGYGGYYGAGTIQGLAAMYYSHLHPEHAVELNRCIYNNMVDKPYPKKYDTPEFANVTERPCITLEETCEDCRETDIDDIITIHLTNCFKPWNCAAKYPNLAPLCAQHHYEWFRVRHSLEAHWKNNHNAVSETFPPRVKGVKHLSMHDISFGFCRKGGAAGYRPISEDL